MFCTLTSFKPKARTETLKLTYSDASTKTNDHKYWGDCKMSSSQLQVQPGHLSPSLLFSCTPSAVQPAPSQALGQTQEHRESCPQLANQEAKLMAESNQLRTTADREPRVREMPPPVWIGVTTSTKGLSTFPPLHEEAELDKINSSGYSPAFLMVWVLVVCRHLTVQLSSLFKQSSLLGLWLPSQSPCNIFCAAACKFLMKLSDYWSDL